jgi:tetratricopeptide (TPR) repeat protein
MFCRKCGVSIPDDSKFCIKCGTPVIAGEEPVREGMPDAAASAAVSAAQSDAPDSGYAVSKGGEVTPPANIFQPAYPDTQPVFSTPTVYTPVPPVKKLSRKARTILITAVCSVVVGVAIMALILVAQENDRASRYAQAMGYLDSGNPEKAEPLFEDLGTYKSAEKLAEESRNLSDYQAAGKRMENGEYEDAMGDFQALGGYKDSSDLAGECQNWLNYAAAKKLMDNQNYTDALAAFNTLGGFQDSASLAQNCQTQIDYIAADAAFNEGKFYTAYAIFTDLGQFKDSTRRAGLCKQKFPATGQIYRNKDIKGKGATLKIKLPKGSKYTELLRVYTSKDVLVSTVCISPGKTTSIKLPPGTYKMKTAYGEFWFGKEELFGDIGAYEQTLFDGGSETTKMKKNWIYTLTLDAENGNLGSKKIVRNNF